MSQTPPTAGSWWTTAPRFGFTAVATNEHVLRMSSATYTPGLGLSDYFVAADEFRHQAREKARGRETAA